ncbi:MAG TPA: MBG domain-containing protein [Geomonas sp.]|nr:MBG domain-containing protein [Geomonas sp.]
MARKTIILLLLLLLPSRLLAASVYIDGFRIYSSGTVNLSNNGAEGRVKAVAVQPWDGKVLIGGNFTATGGSPKKVLYQLARLNTDGTLDSGFTPAVTGRVNVVTIQMEQSDKRRPVGILLGGSFTSITDGAGEHPRNGLARLKIDGSVDDSFDPASQPGTVINAITVHPATNSILVGGTFTGLKGLPAGTACSNLARISASDGSFQDGFQGGVSVGSRQAVNAILVQDDGKVVVGGGFQSPQPYLVRFHDTGLRDQSFTPLPNGVVRALAIQADWSILLGGEFSSLVTSNFPAGSERQHLARVSNDGILDTFNPAPDGTVAALAVQPDGRVVAGGTFVRVLDKGGSAASRHRVARFAPDGSLDAMDADLRTLAELSGGLPVGVTEEGSVEALAVQPDEKLLVGGSFAGAAGRPRSLLARYYGFGTLDDDTAKVGPTIDQTAHDFMVDPDGMVTALGYFYSIWSQPLKGMARLNPDWTLADDPHFNDSTGMRFGSNGDLVWSPLLNDQYVLVGGGSQAFLQDSFVIYSYLLGKNGELDLTLPYNVRRINDTPQEVASADFTLAAAEAPDGLLYLGGLAYPDLVDVSDPSTWGTPYFLTRLSAAGAWDHSFDAPAEAMRPVLLPQMEPWYASSIIPFVSAMLIEPGSSKDDYKFIIGTNYGSIFRINKDGSLDPGFSVLRPLLQYDTALDPFWPDYVPSYVPFPQPVRSLSFDKDGQLIAGGAFNYPLTRDGKTWQRNLIRINRNRPGYQDGSIDESFAVATSLDHRFDPQPGNSPNEIRSVSVQADGGMLISGWFDHLMDADGSPVEIRDLARIESTGKLDPGLNFGPFGISLTLNNDQRNAVYRARLQPDGKGMVFGAFGAVAGDTGKAKALRFAGGWASQELSVSPDGSTITWARGIEEPDSTLCGVRICGGRGPELKRVLFYYSEDGKDWQPVGEGVRTSATSWQLTGLTLGKGKGWNQNRYIRARGLMAGDNGSGQFLETVRMYYLKPPVRVSAQPLTIAAGATPVFAPQFFYDDGSNSVLTPVAASLRGAPVFTTTATTSSPPGDYPVSTGLGNFTSWMYSFSPGDSTLTLVPVAGVINVTAFPQRKAYGDPDPPLGYAFSPRLPEGVTVSGTLSRDAGETVAGGPYAIRQGTLTLTGGYLINFAGSTLTIDPKPVTVAAAAKKKSYGDPDPPFTYTVTPPLTGSDTFTGALSRAVGETVAGGPYAIRQGTLGNANYAISYLGEALTIEPRGVTVTAGFKMKNYGDPDPQLTYMVSPPLIGSDLFTGALSRAPGESVAGSPYQIGQGTLTIGSNYAVSYAGAALTIAPRPVTVTASVQQKSYGAPDPPLSFEVSPPLVGSDSFTGSLSRLPGETVAASPYPIQQGTLSAGSDYAITFTGASLTITRAVASVTPQGAAKTYGDPDPPLSGVLSGFLPADQVTASYSRAAGETVSGGPYPIVATLAPADLSNYQVSYYPAELTINRREATVTAGEAGKVYGQPDPDLPVAGSGFLAADLGNGRITCTASRAPGEAAQTYQVTPAAGDSGTSLLANYAVQLVPGPFTIAKAPLTITAEDKARSFGSPNPLFTVQYAGLASFDTLASLGGVPLVTTTAGDSSPRGSYPITVSLGTLASGNYSYAFVNGLLTVGAASQLITFNALRPKTYGDADFDPGATASSGLAVSYTSSAAGVASVAGSMLRVAAPGLAEITASQVGDNWYLAAPDLVRTLLVNPPPGNALDFDGMDDLVRIKDAPQLNFGGKPGFTIELWLQLNGSQPDGTGLLSKGGCSVPCGSAGYQLFLQQDRIGAEISDGNQTVGAAQGLLGSTSLNDGYWHHVALAVDRAAATATLYLDGRVESQVSDPAIGLAPDSSDDLLVGVDRREAQFLRGRVDEVRLWEVARSRDDIRGALSQIIDPLDEPQLAAYYHFDEGDAGGENAAFTSAPDRTANGGNGTLHGFALSGPASNWVRSGALLPLLETGPLSAITSGSATGGGLVYPNYFPATDAGLCWGSSPQPGFSDSCVHAAVGSGGFSVPLTGLAPGGAYHVRAFAVNAMGTAFGNDLLLQAARLDQAITIAAFSDRTYGDAPFPPSATASSGLPVSYASSDPSVAVVENGAIRVVGAGSTLISASQGGDGRFNPAAVVSVSLNVLKAPLTVSADNKSRAYQTANPVLTASYAGFVNGDGLSALSGAPGLSTSASTASPVGEYPIEVDTGALSSASYRFLAVPGTLKIYRSCQLIIFPPIAERTFGDPPFTVSAAACSEEGISFASSNPRVALVSGSLVTITGAGSALITASQSGSGSLEPAAEVSQTLVVHKSGQAVIFPALPQKVLGDAPFTLTATASSGLPVSYQGSDPAVALVTGSTLTVLGGGTSVICASQAGNDNYQPALPACQPLAVAVEGEPPALTLSTLSSGAVTADPVLNVTGSATDASGVALLTVNGSDLTGRAALFSAAVWLIPGDNNVTVAARDGAGNTVSETVTVTLDAVAPFLSLNAPADNSVTNASLFSAAGSVAAGSALAMAVNSAPPQELPVADGKFAAVGYLAPGVNTIEFFATLQGEVSRAKRSIIYSPGKPSLAISEPGEDTASAEGSVLLRGCSDAQGSGLTVTIDADGTLFTPSLVQGSFQQQIPLKQSGATLVTATVTDGSGNSSVAYRTIVAVPRVLGDLDGNGRVEIADAVLALRMATGASAVTAGELARADVAPLVNGVPQPDGVIGVGDVVVILRKVVGLVEF